MKEIVSNLVDVILRMMQDRSESPMTENAMRTWLAGQGYKKRDIDAALKLLHPRLAPPVASKAEPYAVRQLMLHEQLKMSPEARSGLARLEFCGLITEHERELVLDHLGQIEGEVGISELEYLLSWLVCGGRDVEFQQTLVNVLENRQASFH